MVKSALLVGLSFVTFACWGIDELPVESRVLAKTTRSWDGSELPGYPAGQPEVTILEITIPPGTRVPMHKHPVINAGVMLEGSLKVISETGEILYLNPGDTIVELVNKWHYGENTGDVPVRILVFYAGIQGTPITLKKQD